ncbi:MAG: ATPase [Sphingomicrobium sp.]|nr:ATPase [Sphingomonadales bacterium]
MPQLNQLSDVALSQILWMLLVLGFIYFVIGRGMVPKIQSTVDDRDRRIADDLAAAERAKAEADSTEESYRDRMDASRGEAAKLTFAAKQAGASAAEANLAKADQAIQARIAEAAERIKASRTAAVAEIEALAAELTQDIAARVAGMNVSRDEAIAAVKEVGVHG